MAERYSKYNGRSHDWHRKVCELIKANWKIMDIAKHLGVTDKTIRDSIEKYTHLFVIKPVCFGYKNEAYLTEEEMLNGYELPKYSDLSETEKQIYDGKKEKRNN